jgi:hypothetical protein
MSESKSKPLFLSASRIETFLTCSQLYAAKYLWKLPDNGNDGSRRGSTVHDVLDILLKPRHKKNYSKAIHHNTCAGDEALWRTLRRIAKRYEVDDKENLDMMDSFIMTALKNDFFGPKGTTEAYGEKEFNIMVNEGGRRYNLRGYIDQTFKVHDEEGALIVIRDFKSSKQKFEDNKVDDNIQSYSYQLAAKILYPHVLRRKFHFLFLKFPKAPVQHQPSFTDEQLTGFEWRLTFLQEHIEKFTDKNAADNYAALDADRRWLCGKEGKKKDGTPMWICGARNPMEYYVLVDKDGSIDKSALREEDLTPKEGQVIEVRKYKGCSYYWNQTTGKRTNFN